MRAEQQEGRLEAGRGAELERQLSGAHLLAPRAPLRRRRVRAEQAAAARGIALHRAGRRRGGQRAFGRQIEELCTAGAEEARIGLDMLLLRLEEEVQTCE